MNMATHPTTGRRQRVLSAGLLSGLLSYGLVWLAADLPEGVPLPDWSLRYAPGLVFALLVLLPGRLPGAWPALRLPLGVAAVSFIYFLMVQLASELVVEWREPAVAACGIAGGIGALLTAASLRAAFLRPLSLLAVAMAFVLGTLGGSLIGQAIQVPEQERLSQLLVLAGFCLWQAGVGFALLRVDPQGEAC